MKITNEQLMAEAQAAFDRCLMPLYYADIEDGWDGLDTTMQAVWVNVAKELLQLRQWRKEHGPRLAIAFKMVLNAHHGGWKWPRELLAELTDALGGEEARALLSEKAGE